MKIALVGTLRLGALLVVVSAACAGETYVVEARLSDGELGGLGCIETRQGLTSLHVQVLEWGGWDEQSEIGSECISVRDDPRVADIATPAGLMDYFGARGFIARGIPTDVVSIVRVRGYPVDGCPTDNVEPVTCAMPTLHVVESVSEPTLLTEASTSDADTIPFMVVCHPEVVAGPPSVCSNTVSVHCSDNVCGFNETSAECGADCGAAPDLCRFYRACAYFRRP